MTQAQINSIEHLDRELLRVREAEVFALRVLVRELREEIKKLRGEKAGRYEQQE